jgi:rSAM/selenodomain-associated transferase 2
MHLSIIIPTLNEAGYLAATVACLRRRARLGAPEVIVADCGSVDGTVELAEQLAARLCVDPPLPNCRAGALNRGAAAATGDVLLFLDADTLPPRAFDHGIAQALRDPRVVGGAFEFALDGRAVALRLVEIINRLRYRLWPRYYGDQGLFVRADVFRRLGGYPEQGILEASAFSLRLATQGPVVLLRQRMTTSARRFLEGGIFRVLAHDTRVWALDLLQRPTAALADPYRNNNHRRGQRC